MSQFFFHDQPPAYIYTLSLHDALPILLAKSRAKAIKGAGTPVFTATPRKTSKRANICADWLTNMRSEEHTSELQSLRHLVCRLLLEKKKSSQKADSGGIQAELIATDNK